MLSRGRALGGEVGSSKAVCAVQRARPSLSAVEDLEHQRLVAPHAREPVPLVLRIVGDGVGLADAVGIAALGDDEIVERDAARVADRERKALDRMADRPPHLDDGEAALEQLVRLLAAEYRARAAAPTIRCSRCARARTTSRILRLCAHRRRRRCAACGRTPRRARRRSRPSPALPSPDSRRGALRPRRRSRQPWCRGGRSGSRHARARIPRHAAGRCGSSPVRIDACRRLRLSSPPGPPVSVKSFSPLLTM